MFPRTTAADQFVDWLVMTSGEPLLVVELALQLELVLGQLGAELLVLGQLGAELLALGWALPQAQVKAVLAGVEGRPLMVVQAGLKEDLFQDSHLS